MNGAPEAAEIKVLTDLRAFFSPFGAIDIKVLTDLKTNFPNLENLENPAHILLILKIPLEIPLKKT